MKKKTALLLSSIMLLSNMSNTVVHAASAVKVDTTSQNINTGTVFVEKSASRTYGTYGTPDLQSVFGNKDYGVETVVNPADPEDPEDSDEIVQGVANADNYDIKDGTKLTTREVAPYLTITVSDAIARGTQLSLTLENAEWFFRNAGAADGNKSSSSPELVGDNYQLNQVGMGWLGDQNFMENNALERRMVDYLGISNITKSMFPGSVSNKDYSGVEAMDTNYDDNNLAYRIFEGTVNSDGTEPSFMKWNSADEKWENIGNTMADDLTNNGNYATYDMTHGYVSTDPSRESGQGDKMTLYVRATYDNGSGLTPIDRNDLSDFSVSKTDVAEELRSRTNASGTVQVGGIPNADRGVAVNEYELRAGDSWAVLSGDTTSEYSVTNSNLNGYILPPNGLYLAPSSGVSDDLSNSSQVFAAPAGFYTLGNDGTTSTVISVSTTVNNWYAGTTAATQDTVLWDHNISHKINEPSTQVYNNLPRVMATHNDQVSSIVSTGYTISDVYQAGGSTVNGAQGAGIINPALYGTDANQYVSFEPIYTLSITTSDPTTATLDFTTDFFDYTAYSSTYNDPEGLLSTVKDYSGDVDQYGNLTILSKATDTTAMSESQLGKLSSADTVWGLDGQSATVDAVVTNGYVDYDPTHKGSTKPSNIQNSSDPRINGNSKIVVPLVVRTTAPGTISVALASTDSNFITPGTYSFASGTTVSTYATSNGIAYGRSSFNLEDIIISERGYGVLRSGIFEMEAPYGYYFDDNFDMTSSGNVADDEQVTVNFLSGLENRTTDSSGSTLFNNKLVAVRFAPDYSDNLAIRGTNTSWSSNDVYHWPTISGTSSTSVSGFLTGGTSGVGAGDGLYISTENDPRTLQFRIQVLDRSTTTSGYMKISNLTLKAEDPSDIDDTDIITLDIRSISADISNGETGFMPPTENVSDFYEAMEKRIDDALDPLTDGYIFVEHALEMGMFERWDTSDYKAYYLGNEHGDSVLIQPETLNVAQRANWDLDFSATEDIPELIAGRYRPFELGTGTDIDTFDESWDNGNTVLANEEHKVAQIRLKENAVNAWWSERVTTFTLTEGIAIRKVEFEDKEISHETGEANHHNNGITAGALTLTKTGGGTYYSSGWNSNEEFFPNDGVTHNGIKVDGNTITLTDVRINADEKATLFMDVWVSIPIDFEGEEIMMSVSGSSIPDQDESTTEYDTPEDIVVATVVKPVTVETQVTDVKIGYQYYGVADIVITETAYGMLEKGKELKVSVTDFITDDIVFTTGILAEAEGFTLSDMVYGSIGNSTSSSLVAGSSTDSSTSSLTFEILKPSTSSTGPGSLTISNVQVKIDRTVPESMESYQVIAWGTAIAENYGPFRDQFAYSPGVATPYINIATSAPDNSAVSSSIVLVEIGATEIVVGRETYNVDAPAFVDTETNSTMIPIRAVSYALGIAEEKVIWDPSKSTVTIDASSTTSPRIVQMTTGSDLVTINGMARTMYAADGITPVSMMISNERSFIPFRALGEALGVEVSWDAENSIAIYNPSKLTATSEAYNRVSDSWIDSYFGSEEAVAETEADLA